MAAGPELLVGGLALRAPAELRSRSHARDGDHGLRRHDPVMAVVELHAPESASRTAPRPHRPAEYDDELRFRIVDRNVEQPGLDVDPLAWGGRSLRHGVAVHARVA